MPRVGRQNGRLFHWPKSSYVKYENQTLEAFVVASCLYDALDCPVAHQKIARLVTVHNCETGLFIIEWNTSPCEN